MSWVTAVWAILIGACIAMALPHLLLGIWQRRAAHLFFVLAAASVIGIAIGELAMMRSTSPAQFGHAQQLTHLPLCVLVVALIGFVRRYFQTGLLSLGLTAAALRIILLIINFTGPPNLNFREITALHPVRFLGETVATPVGVMSSWTRLGELSSLIFLAYVVDASRRLWRKGDAESRRRALVVGGSITFFILVAAGLTALIHQHVLQIPYIISFPFAGILVAMAFELGSDLFRAGEVAQKLQLSEAWLQESEERFRTMADAAPVLMWMAGPDKLCTFFNKAWLEFTGRRMEQELGNGWTEGVHLDDLENCVKTFVTAFDAREPFNMKYRLRRHDGEYRFLTDTGTPRYGVNGAFRGYIGACVDVTDLLEQQQTLHAFEERVTLAAEAAHLGVWELDTKTNELWISDKARELFQFQPEGRITYKEFQDRVHPEDRARRDSVVQEAIRNHGGYEIEYRLLLPDGTVRWIGARARCVSDENGALTRLLGVSMEVTNRKQAEQKVGQLSQRNELILNSAAEGILGLDLQGNHTFVNAAAARMLGYEPKDLIGRYSHGMWHHTKSDGSPYPIEECNIYAAYRDGKVHHVSTEVFWRKDGTSFPVEYSSTPVFDQGRLVGAVVTFEDISSRKSAEEQARRQRDQIDLLSRVSLLGEMTASLAHELNQPLSAIMSNANAGTRFIDKGKADPETTREILVDVAADAQRAHDIIRNVRNTIKKGGVIRQRINLNDVAMKVAHMVLPDAMGYSCEVKTFLAVNLPTVDGDPTQIQQVLINLVGNAFAAMRNTPVSARKVELTTEANGNETIRVAVRDYGAGISDEVRGRLFEQFFTTKEEGLGMGLAIVRSIIEAHGGQIKAENVKDGGARFHFTLPISKEISK